MDNPVNHGIGDKLFNHIVDSNRNSAYYQLTGITTRGLGAGISEMVVQVDSRHTNPLGRVHGGLIASLADAAMGNAIRSLGYKGVTVDFSVSFTAAPPANVELIGRGKVIKTGRNMLFAEAMVYAGETLVAQAKGTFFNTGHVKLE